MGMTENGGDSKRKLLARLLQRKVRDGSALPEGNGVPNGDAFAIPVPQLKLEAVLDPAIRFDAPLVDLVRGPESILLTGATGFLGSFLLHGFLWQTRARIYCLLRCSGLEEGRKRIRRSLEGYGLADAYDGSRIVPVQGDVEHPMFGMSEKAFRQLAMSVDVVYHNAAMVNWVYTYARLKRTNVTGTQEAIRLAACGRLKPLHHISTAVACPLEDQFDVTIVREEPQASDRGTLYGGYSQSKWVAEQLVECARAAGLPGYTFRPGIVTGHSRTGSCNTNDAASRMIKLAVELGVAPDLEAAVDMMPVDYVSRAMIHLSRLHRPAGTIYHLANPRSVRGSDLVAWIRSYGYPMRLVPYDVWRSEMMALAKRGRRTALSSLTPLFSSVVAEKLPVWTGKTLAALSHNTMDRVIGELAMMYSRKSVQLDCTGAHRDLAGTSIVCPPVDEKLLHTYLEFYVRSGFIRRPAPAHLAAVFSARTP
jgi:thioester reductase-like protein